MPLADDNVIQSNSGGTSAATSHVVSLSSGTTAGNTVIITLYSVGAPTAPSDLSLDAGGGATAIGIYRKSDVAASETSWTFTTGAASDTAWYIEELSNVDAEPLDVAAANSGSTANGATLSTGTTAQTAGLSVVSYAAWSGTAAATTWSGYTNDYAEVAEVSGGTLAALSVARKFVNGTTTALSSTATRDAGGTNNAFARVIAYRAADAPLAAPLGYITGWEWGTHGGLGNAAPSSPTGAQLGAQGTFGTNYLIQGSSARNSSYGLRIVQSAGSGGVQVGPSLAYKTAVFGCNVRVVSASATPIVLALDTTASDLNLVYDSSTNKFGVRWGSGTVAYESGTTALNTWRWVDIRIRTNATTHHADWQIETGTDTYTAQTSPADLTGQSAGTTTNRAILGGFLTSQTITAEYDDLVFSQYYSAYPLGPHEIRVLVPETTGASVSGTSANFNEFTANGTLAAFASTSGQRIDEVPPTISASSDGVVQVTVAASDYMNFPMTDPTLASDEVFGGAHAVIPTWGGTGTGTGTLGLRVNDGTTETTIDAGSVAYDGDSLTAASSTYPIWRQGMITPPTGGWTKTKADSLVGRAGYSSDATPDMGVSAFYIEYARRKAITTRQVTIEDPISATVDLRVNPYNSASVSYVITNNDATRSVNFNYSISGTPQTPVTVGPSSNQTVTVNMDAFGDVSDLSLEPI